MAMLHCRLQEALNRTAGRRACLRKPEVATREEENKKVLRRLRFSFEKKLRKKLSSTNAR